MIAYFHAMRIEQRDSPVKGSFVALEGDVAAGRMTYSWSGKAIVVILHTEVDPAFAGKGVGKQLVLAAVELARRDGLKIKLVCPFAKRVFERTPELQDVLQS
jgi:predicted GNAT family acetyltransferase